MSHLDQFLNCSLHLHLKMLVSGGLRYASKPAIPRAQSEPSLARSDLSKTIRCSCSMVVAELALFLKIICKQHKLSLEMM